MSVKERLREFAKLKEKSVSAFEKKVGLSNGYINSMRVSIQPDKVELICAVYPDLNRAWLYTGEGDPILDEPIIINDERMQELVDQLRKEIERLNNEQAKKDEIITRLFDSNVQLQNLLNQIISNAPDNNGAKKREAI